MEVTAPTEAGKRFREGMTTSRVEFKASVGRPVIAWTGLTPPGEGQVLRQSDRQGSWGQPACVLRQGGLSLPY